MRRPTVDLSATDWQFPEPRVHTLPNGITVWHFPMPGQHVAAFELVQPIRLTAEPRELEGVGTIALHALDESTVPHPDMQELLDLEGAALHAAAHVHATRFGGLVPARRLAGVLPLLTEFLTEPGYHPDDVALHVEAQEAAFRTRLSTPAAAARWALRIGLYGSGQRQGRPICGTPETLARITRDEVLAWHRQHYAPTGSVLVVAGDLPDLDTHALDAWRTTATRSPLAEPTTAGPAVLVADVPGAVQATIVVARRSIGRDDPRWAAARLAGHVLAGGFASRLNLELRERLGYTYGIGGGFVPDPTGSLLQVQTSTRTDVAGDALERILDAFRLDTPVTVAELDDAKAFRIGIAPLANETAGDVAQQAAALAEAGLTVGYVNQHTEQLRAVTPDEASATWRELVDPSQFVVAIAGDARTLLPQLAAHDPRVVALDEG
ncbi:pitrilysin family protein [uncultured Tessaracoccus sp.]|uniref:M16 family metallopeptidase n=1 Tax=uncultured Tessaracoccus sp. TaxID=905023 RepID=UPI0025CEED0C|nr:pitrilysin family protein [uncultured Tessaracoccus sp.]